MDIDLKLLEKIYSYIFHHPTFMHLLQNQDRWKNCQDLPSKSFICGFCNNLVSSKEWYKVIFEHWSMSQFSWWIYICPWCRWPNFNVPTNGEWIPWYLPWEHVDNVPQDIFLLYHEARKCCKELCYTASVLVCRKILMNLAVNQGAKEWQKFIEYIEYLSDRWYIPPNGKWWVDHIRKKGNEATHEIQHMTKQDAEDLINFTQMLLVFIYEFPSRVPQISE